MTKVVVMVAAALALAGCASTSRNPAIEIIGDMKRQPRYNPQSESVFFEDGRAMRAPVAGTVARGYGKDDAAFYTGVIDQAYVGRNPLPMDAPVLARGQERFNIYCSPCHDRTGSGRGIVAQRASWLAGNLADSRIRDMADGEIFDVISHGRRSMPAYRFEIGERDRWAIVAYVRALQRAAHGTIEDVPQELRGEVR